MRAGVVVHYLGSLVALIGGFMLVPFGISVYYQEPDQSALLASSALTFLCGATMRFWTRKQPGPMLRKESFLVVALGWALASAFGALPYMLAGTFGSYTDAYFETMSGFTTTGSSVLADIEAQPRGILFWRDFTQWLGGMGIIALFIALVPLTRIGASGASALFEDEAPTPQVDRVTPRLRDTAKALWLIYLVITVAEVLLLVLAGMPLFDSVTNSFGTMATGGYSPRNARIAYYDNPAVEWIITAFMAIAGANFGLYYLVWRGKVRRALSDTELQVYLAILAGCSLLVAVDLMANAGYTSLGEAVRHGAFQIVSLQTTTGFATADFDTWPWFSKSLILMVMFIGASSGSTGGALKVVRLIIVSKYAHRQLYNALHPRTVLAIKMGGRPVPEMIVRESVAFFVLYQSIFLFSALAVTALGLDLITALSGVATTLGNVGPGLGRLGPVLNYSSMPDPVKVIFIFDMYVGRLELWTVLILLRPAFWRES